MAGQLIPSPELAPSIPKGLSTKQKIELWVDLVDTCEQFLLAGLRRRVGPDGDVVGAYRRWYVEHREEHDRTMYRMLEELYRRENNHAR